MQELYYYEIYIQNITFMGMSLMTLFSCQQVNPVNDQPFTTEEANWKRSFLSWIEDNLNCFIDFPTNNTTYRSN
jgi:hypothetical protein